MELRWLVQTHTYETWDDRDDMYIENVSKSEPVLQYKDPADNKWKEVPTYYEEMSS